MKTGNVLKKEHRAFIKRIVSGEPVYPPTGATIQDYIEPLVFECCYVTENADEAYTYGKEVIDTAILYLEYYKGIWEQAKIDYDDVIQNEEIQENVDKYFENK